MFRRFRAKIRVYGNRRHGCSFKATLNFLIWNDVELVGLQNCYLGFGKFWKFLKIFKIFDNFFCKIFPLKNKIFKKPDNMLEGNGWWICVQNFKSISSKMAEIWYKTCQKQALFHVISGLYRDFPNFIFWPILMLQKVFLGHFRVLCENLT